MKLSHRLETIASFVRRGSIIADIGTDHGYIPIYLVKEGISPARWPWMCGKGLWSAQSGMSMNTVWKTGYA